MRKLTMTIIVLTALLGHSGVSKAGLVGTQVTGTLLFNGGNANLFDPIYGYASLGALNRAGTTVAISASATEFGFAPAGTPYSINADFTDSQLKLFFNQRLGSNTFLPSTMTFTDTAFLGLSLVGSGGFESSSIFSASISGDVITVNLPGGAYIQGATLDATYNITSPSVVPEPNSFILLGIAAALGSGWWLCRKMRVIPAQGFHRAA
jgi:hypothetical protein